jgi:SRSO17 transposase
MGKSRIDSELVIRGRTISSVEIEDVRQLITQYGKQGRTHISRRLAEIWQWRQPNGRLKDLACRSILLELENRGLIKLPPHLVVKDKNKKPRLSDKTVLLNSTAIESNLEEILPLTIKVVQNNEQAEIWNNVTRRYHYLGHKNTVGQSLRYLVYSRERLIASLGWQSAVGHLLSRDYILGWNSSERKEYLNRLATNNRYLIMPWLKVKNAASHILSQSIKRLERDWEDKYGYKLWALETFVDPERFRGSCYKASNWLKVGRTKGYGKEHGRFIYHGKIKEVYLYVLDERIRQKVKKDKKERLLTREFLLSKIEEISKLERRREVIIIDKNWKPELEPEFEISEEDIDKLGDELLKFHAIFEKGFKRIEQRGHGLCYLQGLLSEMDRKSMEPIALKFMGEKGVRNLQRFMSDYKWDEELIARCHKEEVSAELSTPDGVFSVDSSENVKKGKESVGVARQYCGRLGKIENSQSGVYLAYASPKGYALIDRRLYMPEIWFNEEHEERRQKCKVPEELVFKKKTELASEMINEICASNLFPGRWITCDTIFGNSPEFLERLPKEMNYLADVPNTYKVRLKNEQSAVRVSDVAKNIEWVYTKLTEGSKGPIFGYVNRIRVFVTNSFGMQEERWLFLRKNHDTGEIKYQISNAVEDIPLKEMIRVSTLRWPIEQSFQEGKSELGMGDYEHRSWPAWHRHMTYVFLAQLFLLRIRHLLKKNSSHNATTNTYVA